MSSSPPHSPGDVPRRDLLIGAGAGLLGLSVGCTPKASTGSGQGLGTRDGPPPVELIAVTHGSNTDSFWNVVKNGIQAASSAVGATTLYRNPPTGDLTDMARLIDASVASKPQGLIVSIPDPDALGDSIRAAVAAGIPVASINSGSSVRESLGCLFHVGQPEYDAGVGAGKRAAAAGVKRGVVVNHEIANASLTKRGQGYADGLGIELEMIDVGKDPTEVKNRVKAYLASNGDIDGLLTLGPPGSAPTLAALEDLSERSIHMATFDLDEAVMDAIKAGTAAFAIDQQQYLQGYFPVVALALNARFGLLPGADILSGPGFVTAENIDVVTALVGSVR